MLSLKKLQAEKDSGVQLRSLISCTPFSCTIDNTQLLANNVVKIAIFTALHAMQTRSSDEISVCPSVRLSNACIVTKWKKNLSRFLYHAKDHSVYFYEKKNGWWGATPSI